MTWESDPRWLEFVDGVRKDAAQKIAGSDAVVSIAPAAGSEGDVKFAVELGLSIMLDKPIIVVVAPGAEVPAKLRLVADTVVVADLDLDEGRLALANAMRDLGIGDSSSP